MKKITTLLMALLAVLFFTTSCEKEEVEVPIKVLVLGADSPEWIADVQSKIKGTGLFEAVDTFCLENRTPTLAQLQAYDAVFLFTDDDAKDAVATGNALASYIEGGGGVVDAVFTGNYPIEGNYTQYSLYTNSDQTSGAVRTLGAIANVEHELVKGILSFNGGTASYYNSGGTLAAGTTILAKYDNDAPFIVYKENVGVKKARRVFLNFFPPSKDVREDLWDPTTDGAKIMGGALVWVANN